MIRRLKIMYALEFHLENKHTENAFSHKWSQITMHKCIHFIIMSSRLPMHSSHICKLFIVYSLSAESRVRWTLWIFERIQINRKKNLFLEHFLPKVEFNRFSLGNEINLFRKCITASMSCWFKWHSHWNARNSEFIHSFCETIIIWWWITLHSTYRASTKKNKDEQRWSFIF